MRNYCFGVSALATLAASVACGGLLGIESYRDCVASECDSGGDAATAPDVVGFDVVEASTCPPRPQQVVCTTFPQSGCKPDENCEVTTVAGATSCSSIGTNALWNNCSGYGQCVLGAECIGGVCKPFCCAASDCNGRRCVTATVGASAIQVPGLQVCNAGCDPMKPSIVCGPAVQCTPSPWDGKGMDDGNCYGPTGAGMGDGGCVGTNQLMCAPGYYCLGDGRCAKWCRVGHDEDCPGSMCAFFNKPAVIDGVQYGTCK